MKKSSGQQEKHLSAWQIGAVYIGTVVGAGFASGQEILQFFGYFGLWGIAGLAVAVWLFGVLGAKVMLLAGRMGGSSYRPLIDAVGGQRLGPLLNFVITFFLFGILVAMVAGTGAAFKQEFGLPHSLGLGLMAGLSGLTVVAGLGRVIDAISLVAPFLIIAVLGVSFYVLLAAPVDLAWSAPEEATLPGWPLSALAYVSYNLTLALPILAPMGSLAAPPTLKKGAFLGALGLGLSALAILLAIISEAPAVTKAEIPMLAIAAKVSPAVRRLYAFILVAEVYTTAIGSLYGFVSRLASPRRHLFKALAVLVAAAAFLAGHLGFAKIVATVYPAMGIAGFLFLFLLIKKRDRRA